MSDSELWRCGQISSNEIGRCTIWRRAAVSVLHLGETLSSNHAVDFALITAGAAIVFLNPLG